jgi:pimeloyl-ACP methyl ester carboxylesterase
VVVEGVEYRNVARNIGVASIGRVIVLVGLAWCGYYAVLFVLQRRLLFPAPRGPVTYALPRDAERVQLHSTGGALPAWLLLPTVRDAAAPVLVFLHGNGERAEDWLTEFGDPRAAGMAVLVVEYPGYGEAPGAPSQTSLTDAALAAYDWLQARPDVDGSRIVVYGRSLGGGVATRLATRRHVAAVVLESSFTSLRALAGRFLAPGFLVRDPFDSRRELRAYHGALLVLHGERDDIAPFAHGRALAAAVPGAEFVALPCGHNDCARPWPQVLAFLRAHGVVRPLQPDS